MELQLQNIFIVTKLKSIMFLLFFISAVAANLSFANEENLVATSQPTSSLGTPSATTADNNDASQKMDSENASAIPEDNSAPENKISVMQRAMPVYGNWCGANHPKDMSAADEPIDLLDQACKKHDVCYENEGYLNCSCDDAINQELITGLKENQFGKTEAVVARSFHLYFNGSPCNGDHSTKVGPSRLLHNVVKKASDRTVDVLTSLPIVGDAIEKKISD